MRNSILHGLFLVCALPLSLSAHLPAFNTTHYPPTYHEGREKQQYNQEVALEAEGTYSHAVVDNARFSGVVRDKSTLTPLSHVELRSVQGKVLAQTDAQGHFVIEEEKQLLDVVVFLRGYAQQRITLHHQDTEVFLTRLGKQLETVTITAVREKRGNNIFTYSPNEVKHIATLAGETDIMRYMQVLPGVSQGMEGGMGFYVRGAGNGNNRVELDGVPITAPTHLFGLFSTFPADIVEKSTFQMGGISAASGDLLSSLLKVETPRPDLQHYHAAASVSPLMLGGSVQGYLFKKGHLSFQLAGRTSLLRPEFLLTRLILGKENVEGDFNPQVQDGYAKLFWKIHPKHTLEMMVYGSHDKLAYEPNYVPDEENFGFSLGWDNSVAKLQWNYSPSSTWRWSTMAYNSNFTSLQQQQQKTFHGLQGGLSLGAEKRERAVRSQLFGQLGHIVFNGGIDARWQQFHPVMQKVYLNLFHSVEQRNDYATTLSSAFAEGEYTDHTYKLKAGLRYTLYNNAQSASSHHLDVRLQGSAFLTPHAGVEVTFDRLTQFQHSIEGLPLGWALDLLVPASSSLPPELSHQAYAGGFWGNDDWYATLGAYYRHLQRVTSYQSLLNLFSVHNVSWEEDVVSGKGASYGMELWIEKRRGRWTGSLAYTLSRTTRQYAGLNHGASFPFKFDRTHNLNVQAQYLVRDSEKKAQHFNAALYFSSGHNMTVPVSVYQSADLPYWETMGISNLHNDLYDYHSSYRTEMSSINGYRLRPYFRIDVGYSFLWKHRTWHHELTLSLYNVLNQKNPYLVFHEDGAWKQLSLLSIVPSIRWEVHF